MRRGDWKHFSGNLWVQECEERIWGRGGVKMWLIFLFSFFSSHRNFLSDMTFCWIVFLTHCFILVVLAVEVQRLILMICEKRHPGMMSLAVERLEAVAVWVRMEWEIVILWVADYHMVFRAATSHLVVLVLVERVCDPHHAPIQVPIPWLKVHSVEMLLLCMMKTEHTAAPPRKQEYLS